MESLDALLEALAPWLRVLQATTEISGLTTDPSEPMQPVVLTEKRIDERMFEALELLALLGGLDYDAWKQAMHMTWPDAAKSIIDISIDRALPLGCEIRTGLTRQRQDLDAWLQRVLAPRAEIEDSPGYLELRTRLEAAYAYKEQDEQSFEPKPIPREQLIVSVWVSMFDGDYAHTLRKMMQLMAVQQATLIASKAKNEPFKPLFRVERLSLSSPDNGLLSVEAMLYMVKIVECGGHLDRLTVFGVDTSDNLAPLLTSGLQVLMGCENQSEPAPFHPERGRVKAVEPSRLLNRHAVAAVYSALATSQSVERVFLNNPPRDGTNLAGTEPSGSEDRRHLWHWIAYAFFSGYATHRIRDTRIIVDDLRMQDVAYVEEFLQHPRPLELLFEGEAGVKVSTGAAFATASRFYLSPPSTDPTAPRPRGHPFARQQVRILSARPTNDNPSCEDFESVLLPGYGRAWVKRSDIEERVSSSGLLARPLQSLVFHDVTDESAPAVLKLLQLVGREITALEFPGVQASKPLDAWLLAVFESCPQLVELTLHDCVLQSLDTIAQAFESRLTCLRELRTHHVHVVDTRNAPGFILKLADLEHPMTKSLRKLQIGVDAPSGPRRELWDASREVLRSNYRLRAFSLRAYFNADAQVEIEGMLPLFEAGKTAIHEQRQPLSLHSKLAFLSAVGRDDAELPAMRAMDASVLTLVFQFAAQCHTRSVAIDFSNPADHWRDGSDEEDDEDDVE